MPQSVSLLWFRRDLRIAEHPALSAAVRSGLPVVAVYVQNGGQQPETENCLQTAFVRDCLNNLQIKLAALGIPLTVLYGKPEDCLPPFARSIGAQHIFCHRLYDAASVQSDRLLDIRLSADDIAFQRCADGIFPPEAARIQAGNRPFTRFGEYRSAWLEYARQAEPPEKHIDLPLLKKQQAALSAELRGICNTDLLLRSPTCPPKGGKTAAEALTERINCLPEYAAARAFPAKHTLAPLSPHLSQGSLSPRRLFDLAQQYRNENGFLLLEGLIRREFAQQYAFQPQAVADSLPSADTLSSHQTDLLQRWQNGQTGYPLVDAAMRCLRHRGLIHADLRRLTAEFLLHHLRLPLFSGESWFAQNLLDFDPAVNHANWLIASRTEAVPFTLRSHKLDPDGRFIRRHLPELAHLNSSLIHFPPTAGADIDTHGYPLPIPPQTSV